MPKIEPKPPEIIQKIEWIRIYGLTYWKHLAIAFILLIGLWIANTISSEKSVSFQNSESKSAPLQMNHDDKYGKEKLPTSSEIFDTVKKATVAIALYNENDLKNPYTIIGSGFCIHHRGIIVTSRHVVDAFLNKPFHKQPVAPSEKRDDKKLYFKDIKAQALYAIFFDVNSSSEQISVPMARVEQVIAKSDYDLAVARVHPHPAFPDGFPSLQIESYEAIHEGMEIATCGFPLGNFLMDKFGTMTSSFTKGILSSVIPSSNVPKELLRGFQLDLTATHGNSGGPVFSMRSGKVFGVLQGGIQKAQGYIISQPVWPIAEGHAIDEILKKNSGTQKE
ncbi:MAG: serine protease [Pseudomonadota bacterium]